MPTSVQTGPCVWPIDMECCKGLPDDVDPALVQRWRRVASQILWAYSGRRIGLCLVEVRPCKTSCEEKLGLINRWNVGTFGGGFAPYIRDGKWFNATCGCTSDCSCTELCEVYLPGPVHSIVEVTIDGIVVDPATYRVDAPGKLVRQQPSGFISPGESPAFDDDDGCWPSCQDLTVPADDPGSFVVRYEWGIQPDEAAIAALSELTCELIKSCLPAGSVPADCRCRLPANVQRVTRQGVTIDLVTEPTSIFAEGRTGLPLVDMWLHAVNPHGLVAPPRVLSPDFKRPRVTTWAAP